ncbi:hypothetical protein GP2143_01225 [marine gamma proteobacterium HTCC2143]|uniref:Serine aminopeptidase S33 domain-containing protein n=1 Tax=marine gamma proteobacterium HTCC2143 TaxID=247633 RepID=A0YGI3_9GAMM|nr:hypothetical protein GP2143_01225 [marine gamma proteobacterium HTCC2143]
MKEEVVRFGEKNRGFGMATLPEEISHAPMAVCFNAGLTHREGPYRLNTLLCRALAKVGYISVRVDLSGKGDTPTREGLSNRESVALDWQSIKQSLFARFGDRKIVLIGLCSGADNAIKISAKDMDVKGLVLLDMVSPYDKKFFVRELKGKLSNIYKWLNLPKTIVRRFSLALGIEPNVYAEMAALRDKPTQTDMDQCFRHLSACSGRILAVFTSQAMNHYNQQGQFVRAMNIPGLEECCQEVFWPLANHLYKLQSHRDRLVQCVEDWAGVHLERFRADEMK